MSFLSSGGDDNVTPLHDACASGSVNMILLLVRFGARKDAKDSKGYVPRYASTVRTAYSVNLSFFYPDSPIVYELQD